jgi:hypothetical protein
VRNMPLSSSADSKSKLLMSNHAGICIPMFAVTLADGLDSHSAGIRLRQGKSFGTNDLRMRQDPLDMGQAGITFKDARHGIAPPVACITQTLTVD